MRDALRPVTSLNDHVCAKVLRVLDSYIAGELSVESNHEVLAHLERCPSCRAESEAREALRAAVRRVASATGEPRPGFENEVRALLASTPAPRRSTFFSSAVTLLAASLVAAAMLAIFAWRQPAGEEVASVHAGDRDVALATGTQRTCAETYSFPLTPPPLEKLENRLGPAFAPALRATREKLHGYDLVAAHRCAHTGTEVVHFLLRPRGLAARRGVVSVIAVPRGEGDSAAREAVEHARSDAAGTALAMTDFRHDGFDVVSAEAANVTLFVVSHRGADDNREIGRAVLPALVAAFAG